MCVCVCVFVCVCLSVCLCVWLVSLPPSLSLQFLSLPGERSGGLRFRGEGGELSPKLLEALTDYFRGVDCTARSPSLWWRCVAICCVSILCCHCCVGILFCHMLLVRVAKCCACILCCCNTRHMPSVYSLGSLNPKPST